MTVYSDLPEYLRGVWELNQSLTGVPTGTPEPLWPVAGDNDILCTWTGAEITRLLSAIRFGADMLYPDEGHTVLWSFLRQLEYPQEIPEGDCMEVIVVSHDGTADGGSSVADKWGEIDAMQNLERNDVPFAGLVNEGGYNQLAVPAGLYYVDLWHVCWENVSSGVQHGQLALVDDYTSYLLYGSSTIVSGGSSQQGHMLHLTGSLTLPDGATLSLYGKLSWTQSGNGWGDYTAGYGGRFGVLTLLRRDIPE